MQFKFRSKTTRGFPLVITFLFVVVGLLSLVNVVRSLDPVSFNFVNSIVASVRNITGIPAPNTGLIINNLSSGFAKDNSGNVVKTIDSPDRCEVIDPNLAEIKKVHELGRKAGFSLVGETEGGFNLAPIIDFGTGSWTASSDDGVYNMITYAQAQGMSFFLGMVLSPSKVSETVQFIREINAAEMLPVVRLCYPGNCEFKGQGDIEGFFRNVASQVGVDGQFIAILGPNEPGTAGEMESFGVPTDAGGYDTLVSWANGAAGALQQFRVVNGGPMFLAPAVFNLSNTQNDDVLNYLRNGNTIQPELFDFLLGNAYDLPGNKAYNQYNPGGSPTATGGSDTLDTGNPAAAARNVKSYVEQNNLRFVLTEFGSFTGGGGKAQAIESFKNFCEDTTVVGTMFFRSFKEFEGISPIPRPELYSFNDITEIIGGCKGGLGGGALSDSSWQSCNFDACTYDYPYTSNSKAKSCGSSDQVQPSASLLVKCDNVGNPSGDCYISRYETFEVGLPIKQFGSTNPLGSETSAFMPVCAQAANLLGAESEYDALNQFAGKLSSGDGSFVYPMPWLGSAINCAAQLLPYAQNILNSSEWPIKIHPASRIDATYDEIALELNGNLTLEGNPLTNIPADSTDDNKIIDERAICVGDEETCTDKGSILSAGGYDYNYTPVGLPQRYTQVSQCKDSSLVVKATNNNYIYGPEIKLSDPQVSTVGYSDDICRRYAGRNSGANAGANGFGKEIVFGKGAFECIWNPEGTRATPSGFLCGQAPGATLPSGQFVNYPEAVAAGVLSINPEYTNCFAYKYNDSDEIYVKDETPVTTVPDLQIEGAYDALFGMYERLQYEMAGRNLKIIFRENIGWEALISNKVRDGNRPFESLQEHPYSYALGAGKTGSVQCNLPANIFKNETYLAKGSSIASKSVYYDWLGYIDIMQEWISTYLKNDVFSRESAYANKLLNNPNINVENLHPGLQKEVLLRSGEASMISAFPILSCDDIEYTKVDPDIIDPEKRFPKDVYPTCIASLTDESYDSENLLAKFLCEQGYKVDGVCESFSNICIEDPDSADGSDSDIQVKNIGNGVVASVSKESDFVAKEYSSVVTIDKFASETSAKVATNGPFRNFATPQQPEGLVASDGSIRFIDTTRGITHAIVWHNGSLSKNIADTSDFGNYEYNLINGFDKATDPVIVAANDRFALIYLFDWNKCRSDKGFSQEEIQSAGCSQTFTGAQIQSIIQSKLQGKVEIAITGAALISGEGKTPNSSLFSGINTDKDPRTLLGWDSSRFYFVNLDAANLADMISFSQSNSIPNLLMVDGGGSTQMYYENGFSSILNSEELASKAGTSLRDKVYWPGRPGEVGPRPREFFIGVKSNATAKPVTGEGGSNSTFSLIYPTSNTTIASAFGVGRKFTNQNGEQIVDFHKGVDFFVQVDSEVRAAAGGVVIDAGFDTDASSGGLGYYVKIRHSNGFVTLYGHNSSLKVKKGDAVSQGDIIALSGSTGNSSGPHVHLELRKSETCRPNYTVGGEDGCAIDPVPYLTGKVIEDKFECIAPEDFEFKPGFLSCEVDLQNTKDGIDWQSAVRQIEARVEAYNLDSNASYTWLANLEVPENPDLVNRSIGFLGSQEAYNQDLKQRKDMTGYLISTAIGLGINPRLAYALWVEETAGSAVGSRALGCLYFRNGTPTSTMPVGRNFNLMQSHLNEQLKCLQTYIIEFPKFSEFMCTYSGEEGRPTCDLNNFKNNPNFPTNLCKYYFFRPI